MNLHPKFGSAGTHSDEAYDGIEIACLDGLSCLRSPTAGLLFLSIWGNLKSDLQHPLTKFDSKDNSGRDQKQYGDWCSTHPFVWDAIRHSESLDGVHSQMMLAFYRIARKQTPKYDCWWDPSLTFPCRPRLVQGESLAWIFWVQIISYSLKSPKRGNITN